jgi:hypothetical protein
MKYSIIKSHSPSIRYSPSLHLLHRSVYLSLQRKRIVNRFGNELPALEFDLFRDGIGILTENDCEKACIHPTNSLRNGSGLGGISNVGAYPTKFVDALVEPASATPVDGGRTVYSICEMCPFHCGIKVTCNGGIIKTIERNPKEPHSKYTDR